MISDLKNILFEKVDATGLAVFRIFYSTVLLAEILSMDMTIKFIIETES